MRWLPKSAMGKPSNSPSVAVADERFEHIQPFFDTTHGQIPFPHAYRFRPGSWVTTPAVVRFTQVTARSSRINTREIVGSL
jgi:hypothetical protein